MSDRADIRTCETGESDPGRASVPDRSTQAASEPEATENGSSVAPRTADTGAWSRKRPRVSVVVPGLNEAASLPELAERVHASLGGKIPYELIFVDDGSTDNTWKVVRRLHLHNPAVRGVRLRANFGKAMALSAGFARARGKIVVMMDADLQDDPSDLPTFLAQIHGDLDMIVGWKVNRLDPLNRRVLSKIFNGTVAMMTGVHLHDMNCGFKAYRREVLRTLPIYGDLFRFIPVLAKWQGFRVGEVPVKHHPRKHGRSRYGLERILRGIFDLLSVIFLGAIRASPCTCSASSACSSG